MCFSASSSFTSAAFLLTVWGAGMTQVKSKRFYPLAFLPLILIFVQLAEGFIWLAHTRNFYPDYVLPIGAFVFCFINLVIWPWFFPFAFLYPESITNRKKVIKILFSAVVLLQLFILIYVFKDLSFPQVVFSDYSLEYTPFFKDRFSMILIAIMYLLLFLFPLISSLKGSSILFWLILASYIFTAVFYLYTFSSVWCFFGAIASCSVFFVLWLNSK